MQCMFHLAPDAQNTAIVNHLQIYQAALLSEYVVLHKLSFHVQPQVT